ncbi:hypothetical protein ACERNI_13500 [Camelimonas sp. ID_303_24]
MVDWVPVSGLIVSIVALLASLAAALFTWTSAKQAKRQADAVLGEVPPAVGVYQQKTNQMTSNASIVVEITNHNRSAMLIDMITIAADTNHVDVVRYHSHLKDAYLEIIDYYSWRGSNYTFETPLRVRGCGANSPPDVLHIPFTCIWKDKGDRRPADLAVEFIFRFEGKPGAETAKCTAKVFRPDANHIDWSTSPHD